MDVCTPPYVHAQISINALRSGKNVVCEKPMAASLEECDAMLKGIRENYSYSAGARRGGAAYRPAGR